MMSAGSAAGPAAGSVAVRVVPRKRFGQHFLVDRAAVAAIIAAIAPRRGDRLVEIGPGTGALTAPLLLHLDSMDAVEIDRDLAATLRRRFGDRLRLHQQDALACDFGALADGAPASAASAGCPRTGRALAGGDDRIRVVGNLPYNISSPLLLHLRRFTGHVRDQHFMLQKEVVERIVAKAGAGMGRLTVMLQAAYEVEALLIIAPEAFTPPPKVESALIRMVPRPVPLTRETAALQALLAVGFSQRRKMIRNTLAKWLHQHHPALDLAALTRREPRLGFFTESTRRAEEIPVASWCALADQLGAAAGQSLSAAPPHEGRSPSG